MTCSILLLVLIVTVSSVSLQASYLFFSFFGVLYSKVRVASVTGCTDWQLWQQVLSEGKPENLPTGLPAFYCLSSLMVFFSSCESTLDRTPATGTANDCLVGSQCLH
jgi:hypothetical protein